MATPPINTQSSSCQSASQASTTTLGNLFQRLSLDSISDKDGTNTLIPLFQAILARDCTSIETLFRGGALLSTRNEDGLTAIEACITVLGEEAACKLISKYRFDQDGTLLVNLLYNAGKFTVVEEILKIASHQEASWWHDADYKAELFIRAMIHHNKNIAALARAGMNINYASPTYYQRTPIMCAALHGEREWVQVLLSHNVDLTLSDTAKTPAWSYVAKQCRSLFLQIVRKQPVHALGVKLLFSFCENKEVEGVSIFVDRLIHSTEAVSWWDEQAILQLYGNMASQEKTQTTPTWAQVAQKLVYLVNPLLYDCYRKTAVMYAAEARWKGHITHLCENNCDLAYSSRYESHHKYAWEYVLECLGEEAFNQLLSHYPITTATIPQLIAQLLAAEKIAASTLLIERSIQAKAVYLQDPYMVVVFDTAIRKNAEAIVQKLISQIDLHAGHPEEHWERTALMLSCYDPKWKPVAAAIIERDSSTLFQEDAQHVFALAYIFKGYGDDASFIQSLYPILFKDVQSMECALIACGQRSQPIHALGESPPLTLLRAASAMNPKPSWWGERDAMSHLFCCVAADKKCVQFLFSTNLRTDYVYKSHTLLYWALRDIDMSYIQRFITQGVSFDGLEPDGSATILGSHSYGGTSNLCEILPISSITPSMMYHFKSSPRHSRYETMHWDAYRELLERIMKSREKPAWWSNPQKMTELFCLHYLYFDAEKIVDKIDVNGRGLDGTSVIHHICSQKDSQKKLDTGWYPILCKVIKKEAHVSKTDMNAIYDVCTEQQLRELLGSACVSNNAIIDAAVPLLQKNGALGELLIQRIAKKGRVASNQFFKIYSLLCEGHTQLASLFIPRLEINQVKKQEDLLKMLKIALQHKVDKKYIEQIFARIDFTHDCNGQSALKVLLDSGLTTISNPYARAFLKRCGFVENEIPKTIEELNAFIEKTVTEQNVVLIAVCKLLLNSPDVSNVSAYFKRLDCSERNDGAIDEHIDLCQKILDRTRQIGIKIFDIAFALDKRHLASAVDTIPVPQKDAQISIDTILLSLYDTYSQHQSNENRACLLDFATKVKTKKPFYGTPPAGTPALADFYTYIDNATCHTVQTLLRKAETLVKTHGGTFAALVAASNQEAVALSTTIDNMLKEYIEASKYCGGRLAIVAQQQYDVVVNRREVNAQTSITKIVGEMREGIASSLFPQGEQSSHEYIYFVKTYGQELALSGWRLFQFDDPFVTQQQIATMPEAYRRFKARYQPSEIIEYVQACLRDEPEHGQFISFMNGLQTEAWKRNAIKRLIAVVKNICQQATSFTSANKQAIRTYFEGLNIPLEEASLSSYETLTKALVDNDQLYMALNIQGKKFSFASIATALYQLHIIDCPRVQRASAAGAAATAMSGQSTSNSTTTVAASTASSTVGTRIARY